MLSDSEISICSLAALPTKIVEVEPGLIVSLVPAWPAAGIDHLALPIEDIYLAQLKPYKDAIRAVLAAPAAERILFHCEHGKSRSAAMALIKVYQQNPDGIEDFLERHPEAEPNPLLLILGDELLGADGDLWRRCRTVYKGKSL